MHLIDAYVQKIHPKAKVPTYGTDFAGCFDISCVIDEDQVYVHPGCFVTLRTGLIFRIPEDTVMRIYPRSGLSFNGNMTLCNSVGIIDSDYNNEVLVRLYRFVDQNDSCDYEPIVIKSGDRVAQAEIVPRSQTIFSVSSEGFVPRGNRIGGFGSTGK